MSSFDLSSTEYKIISCTSTELGYINVITGYPLLRILYELSKRCIWLNTGSIHIDGFTYARIGSMWPWCAPLACSPSGDKGIRAAEGPLGPRGEKVTSGFVCFLVVFFYNFGGCLLHCNPRSVRQA